MTKRDVCLILISRVFIDSASRIKLKIPDPR